MLYHKHSKISLQALLATSAISEDEAKAVEAESKKTHLSIEDCIIKLGLLSRGSLDKIINEDRLTDLVIDESLLKVVPYSFCLNKKCVPIFLKEDCLHIATSKRDINTMREIGEYINFSHYKIFTYPEEELLSLIEKSYTNWTECVESSDASSVEIFINRLLIDAATKRASDIHMSCYQNVVKVRYRISGILKKIFSFHKDYYSRVLVKLKVMFLVDITSSFRQRDGRMRKVIFGENVDFRISFHNCADGENVVIRIIPSVEELRLKDLGYKENCLANIKSMTNSRDGIILFVGPTGSGKTTSMYVALKEIDKACNSSKNIMTIEDPVECRISCAQQTDINHHPDMSFCSVLRLVYRQDPDVLMIGEIRDKETAETVVQMSMTGHLVIATLHARDIFAVLDRLNALSVSEDFFVEHIAGIVSQRLVPKKCIECFSAGCENCQNLGYKGVEMVSESLFFNDETRAIFKRKDIDLPTKKHILKGYGYAPEAKLIKSTKG